MEKEGLENNFRGCKKGMIIDCSQYIQILNQEIFNDNCSMHQERSILKINFKDEKFYDSCPESENYFRKAKRCKIINTKLYANLIKKTTLFKEDEEYWNSPKRKEAIGAQTPLKVNELTRTIKHNKSFDIATDSTLTPNKNFTYQEKIDKFGGNAPTPQIIRTINKLEVSKTKPENGKSTVKRILKYDTATEEKKDDSNQSKIDRFFHRKVESPVVQTSARRLCFE
jgi:hypothetical protein